jgi:hypothetical protein
MKRKSLILSALLLAGGTAMAQEAVVVAPTAAPGDVVVLETIKVRPAGGDVMEFGCGEKYSPRPIDVEHLLMINDKTQTQGLTRDLMKAVNEACNAGIADIVVERAKTGRSVVWYPIGYDPVASGPYVVPVRVIRD